MEITWYGQSCFKFKDKNITVVTDPYSEELGFKLPKLTADVVTVSHEHYDHNNLGAVEGEPFVCANPGEFEVKGLFIEGIESFHDKQKGAEKGKNTIFVFHFADMTICHLGDLGSALTNAQVEQIDGVDVLLIPVGGKYTIGSKEASTIINQIEPKMVIPMHYAIEGSKETELASVEDFCKEMGICHEPEKEPLKVEAKDFPEEGMTVKVLSPLL